jgi:hypothetical protein
VRLANVLTLAGSPPQSRKPEGPAYGAGATTAPADGERGADDEQMVRAAISALRGGLVTIGARIVSASVPYTVARVVMRRPMPVRY